MTGTDASGQGISWGRWVTPEEIMRRYGISRVHLRRLLDRGAWPCHKCGKLTRFSPADQRVIEDRWLKYAGEDPSNSARGWREIAMQDELTREEQDAVERGYEASVYLRSLGLSG